MNAAARILTLTATLFTVSWGPASADFFGIKLGGEKKDEPASGSAGPDGAQGESPQLEKCDKPYGTLAVAEPQEHIYYALQRYGLTSPSPVIRMLVQQSNCFVVVERGRAMKNILQERDLMASGELQTGSNMGKGQMVTADYVLTPEVVFSEKNTGGLGGALGGLFGGSIGAAVGGGLKFKEAQTSMLLADTRSSLQIASAQGIAKKADWALGGILGGGGAAGALGAYENTPEGKIIAAGFVDNWNNIVRAIRNNPQLARTEINLKDASGKPAAAGLGLQAGDVVSTKLNKVKIYSEASKSAKVIATVNKNDQMIFTGSAKDGFVSVQSDNGEGWVEQILVRKN
jgi:curli biogenesis system outer membrane secretion channel CsgG